MKNIKEKIAEKVIVKNNGVFYVVISLAIVGLLGIGITVSAGQTFKQMLAEYVAKIIAPQMVNDINAEVPEDQNLGAVSGPDWLFDYQNFNGMTTYVKSGSFADATTSLACVKNPTGATSTVNFAKIDVTGVPTSTVVIYVGTSTSAHAYSTSTVGPTFMGISITANTKGVAYSGYNASFGGVIAAGGNNTQLIVDPTEYVCFVGGDGVGGTSKGFTDNGNTFTGKYILRFIK